jgi:hypothetical protein
MRMSNDIANYKTLEEFSKICGKSVSTIKKRYREIPVIEKRGTEYWVLKGTRYPCAVRRYKIPDSETKRYVLLRAISRNEYVCAQSLNLYDGSFEQMLSGLVNSGLIRENNNGNNYGANAYDCTELGGTVLRKGKKRAIKEIAEIIGVLIGSAVGAASNF